MDHRNHWYGHSAILARYCGLTGGPRKKVIAGNVQHGWTFVHGFGDGHVPAEGYGKFVWSEAAKLRGWGRHWRDFYVIGAPWNYLLELEPEQPGAPREGTVWYPFHGWDTNGLHGDHQRLIDEIRATEPGPVTVCLYWLEYGQRRVRRIYEQAGFRVISHGHRDDPGFLRRQLQTLRAHRRVASNRLTTAIFYGVAAGCEPAVYGDPMYMGGVNEFYEGRDRVPRLWPELHGPDIDLSLARELTAEELGHRYLADPEELTALFRWTALKGCA